MTYHPLTESGAATFRRDWEEAQRKAAAERRLMSGTAVTELRLEETCDAGARYAVG